MFRHFHLTKYKLALLAIIVNTIIWSASAPVLKWSIGDAPPFAFAFYRFLFATILLLPFVIRSIKIKFDDIIKVLILSLVGITAHISFYYLGLALAPSINVPIITSSTPLFLLVGAIILLGEKPKKKVIIGTIISMIGVMIIIMRPLLDHHAQVGSVLGNLYHVLGVVSFVIYTLLLKKYNLKYPFTTLLFWMFLFGTLVFFPLYLFEMESIPFFHINWHGILGITYGSVFSSLIGYFLYNYAANYLKANEIGIFSYAEPIITALVAIPLLGEQITFVYLLGSLFVFSGIIIAENRIHFHPTHNLKTHQLRN